VVGAVGTGIATLSLTATLILAVGVGYSGYALSSKANLRQVDYIRSSLGTSASGYAASVDVSTPGHAISYLPRGVTNYLLGPFPWQVHGLRQLPALVDVLCVWALLPSAVRGLSAARRLVGRRMLVFLLPFGGLAVTLALFLGNFGTIVRERLQVTVVLVPFIALGLARRHGVEALGESEAEHEAGAELARL